MRKLLSFFSIILLLSGCAEESKKQEQTSASITSPNGNLEVQFQLDNNGKPFYLVKKNNTTVIDTSYLGLKFKNQSALTQNFKITEVTTTEADETWEQPWGEQRVIRDHHKQLQLHLEETTDTNLALVLLCIMTIASILFKPSKAPVIQNVGVFLLVLILSPFLS